MDGWDSSVPLSIYHFIQVGKHHLSLGTDRKNSALVAAEMWGLQGCPKKVKLMSAVK
jgi:hypothetical protein